MKLLPNSIIYYPKGIRTEIISIWSYTDKQAVVIQEHRLPRKMIRGFLYEDYGICLESR